ncbi:hypothetical protein OsJ_30480 [Oryza sativa Japonica Group]|nr:hypothetical protein OsJ_30480 [Oryza sativa Japonica Group]
MIPQIPKAQQIENPRVFSWDHWWGKESRYPHYRWNAEMDIEARPELHSKRTVEAQVPLSREALSNQKPCKELDLQGSFVFPEKFPVRAGRQGATLSKVEILSCEEATRSMHVSFI